MTMNSFGKRNFMQQPMRRLSMHSWLVQFFSLWREVGGGRDFFVFSPCPKVFLWDSPRKFPMCSYGIPTPPAPQKFPKCLFPKMFPITPWSLPKMSFLKNFEFFCLQDPKYKCKCFFIKEHCLRRKTQEQQDDAIHAPVEKAVLRLVQCD